MLTSIQESEIIHLVRKVAAHEIMPRYRRTGGIEVSTKSRFDDLVTEADLASERALTDGFKRIMPAAVIIGEESVAADSRVLDQLVSAHLAVIIDPIDGTWNFAHGINSHGVLIAVVERGVTIFGLLYDSVMDDWIVTRLKGGSWYQRSNEEPVKISVGQPNPESQLSGLVAPATFPEAQRALVRDLINNYARVETLRCCCHEYRTLAQGSVDFFIYPKNNVWDNAAGVLAVEEAGGVVRMLDGSMYSPILSQGTIVAAKSQSLLDKLMDDFSVLLG